MMPILVAASRSSRPAKARLATNSDIVKPMPHRTDTPTTCRVIGPDLDPATDDTSKLAAALTNPDELTALGREIAASPMTARHLSEGLRRTLYPAAGA